MSVRSHRPTCVFVCLHVHTSSHASCMRARARVRRGRSCVCVCVPQARQSMLLLGSSPLSRQQRPQCVRVCVINLTWTSHGVRAAVDLTLPLPLSLSLSLSLSPSVLPFSSSSPVSLPLSLSLLSIHPFPLTVWTVGVAGSGASL